MREPAACAVLGMVWLFPEFYKLDPDEALAVAQHEYAHIQLGHTKVWAILKRVWWRRTDIERYKVECHASEFQADAAVRRLGNAAAMIKHLQKYEDIESWTHPAPSDRIARLRG